MLHGGGPAHMAQYTRMVCGVDLFCPRNCAKEAGDSVEALFVSSCSKGPACRSIFVLLLERGFQVPDHSQVLDTDRSNKNRIRCHRPLLRSWMQNDGSW